MHDPLDRRLAEAAIGLLSAHPALAATRLCVEAAATDPDPCHVARVLADGSHGLSDFPDRRVGYGRLFAALLDT
jgi:hypothetical protein